MNTLPAEVSVAQLKLHDVVLNTAFYLPVDYQQPVEVELWETLENLTPWQEIMFENFKGLKCVCRQWAVSRSDCDHESYLKNFKILQGIPLY